MKFVFHGEERIVEKGETAGYQYFLLFPQCFNSFPHDPDVYRPRNRELWKTL